MVNEFKIKKTWIVIFLVCIMVVPGLGAAVSAQDEEPTIEEKYVVELNSVGDGHIEDTLKYSDEDYEVIKEISDENEGFLTRRYSAVDFTGEIVDFKTELDDDKESVIITYDMPGFAYNTEGSWVISGFPEEPDKKGDRTYTITETYTINSEFTLFTDQVIETTSTIKLPADAKDVEYDPNDEALTYKTTPSDNMLGFWRENQTLLMIVFGVLFAIFLGLLVFVMTIRSKPAEATVAAGSTPGTQVPEGFSPPPQHQTVIPPPASQPQGQDQTTGGPEGDASPGYSFCPNCGGKIPDGKHFCTNCGKRVD